MYELGVLFGPMQDIVKNPAAYDAQDEARAVARYCADFPKLVERMQVFCAGEPNHIYAVQVQRFHAALLKVQVSLSLEAGATVASVVPDQLQRAREAIAAVPLPRTGDVVPAGSPFQAYCALRDLCAGDITTELAWIDAYHGPSVFHRFLRYVGPAAQVVLVTAEPASAGTRDRTRWSDFMDVSRMFAAERGPGGYRLVIHASGSLHDRWLRLDTRRLYALGGSAKDAAVRQDFAITPVDATPGITATIDGLLNGGREAFGPSTLSHE